MSTIDDSLKSVPGDGALRGSGASSTGSPDNVTDRGGGSSLKRGGSSHYMPPPGKAGNSQIQQLFARLSQEIEEQKPNNVIHFLVDFLCKHYPEHLQGFAAIWNGDPELEKERLVVVDFFRAQKLPSDIAAHFTNAGFDTLETLCTLTSESLDDIERFNQTRWLPGHKVRLQQTFSDIAGRVRIYREEKEALMRAVRGSAYCHHPQLVTKPNLSPTQSLKLPAGTVRHALPPPSYASAGPPAVTSSGAAAGVAYRSSPNTIPIHSMGASPSGVGVLQSSTPTHTRSYILQ